MKTWKKVAIIAGVVTTTAIALSSCEKPGDDKEAQARKACEYKEDHKSDPDSTYIFQNGTCVGIYTGIQKQDVTVKWNATISSTGGAESGIGFPTRFQLDSIKKLPGTGNIILELYSEDQRGPLLPRHDRNADSLKIWVKEGLVTVKQGQRMLISEEPLDLAGLTEKYGDLGIFITKWYEGIAKAHNKQVKKTGKGALILLPSEINREYAKSQMTRKEKIEYAANRRAQVNNNWNAYVATVSGNRSKYGKKVDPITA